MPDGKPEEFDEDCRFVLRNLSGDLPHQIAADDDYSYSDLNIDLLSNRLRIKIQRQFLGVSSLCSWASYGTLKIAQYLSQRIRNRNISQPLKSGSYFLRIPSSKYKSYTESYYTPPWWCQKDERTSPTWRPCSLPLTVHSFLTPHPETLNMILNGGNNSFARPLSYEPSQNQQQSQIDRHTLTPALELASLLLLEIDGKHGGLSQGGNQRAGTSYGPRLLDSSFSPYAFSASLQQGLISSSMETSWGSSRDGGKGEAKISKPMQSSTAFTSCQESTIALYIHDTSQVLKIPLTSHPVEYTHLCASYSHLYPSQAKLPYTSPMSTMFSPESKAAASGVLTRHTGTETHIKNWNHLLPGSSSKTGGKPRDISFPPFPLPKRRPGPYPRNLTLKASPNRPHCPARYRLQCWLPATPQGMGDCEQTASGTLDSASLFSKEDHQHIVDVMSHAWEEDTRETYGSGLLVYHVYCDGKSIPDRERAPASQLLLSGFVSTLAASYSGKTISNYFYGIQAWHILHGMSWCLKKVEMETMLRAVEKLTPQTSKREQRRPYTPGFIESLSRLLDYSNPLDAAVYACLTTCFYASARLREFTVRQLDGFNPRKHITRKCLSQDQDRNGLKVSVLHLPSTKAAQLEGKDVFWARQDGPTDPDAAMANHLVVNNPPEDHHLFLYEQRKGHKIACHPLTKTKFLEQVKKAALAANLNPLQGHGIRIRSTLEYLL